jgi:hypoxanthine phosphoribosyltransferase
MSLLEEIKRVEREADLIYSQAQVEAALDRMAAAIASQLGESRPIVLAALNGGVIFAGQLLTRLRFPLEIDAINASRYRGATRGGEIHWLLKPRLSLQGRTVLLADDVLDEGVTLAALVDWCREQGAAAVYTAVLVDKQIGRERPCRADFVGLEAEDRYLFGYGMDYKGYLRNAPGIFACKGL